MNGKFIEKYGAAWKDMDADTRSMVTLSEIYDLRESLEPVRNICDTVRRHTLYWRIAIITATIILSALISKFVGLI